MSMKYDSAFKSHCAGQIWGMDHLANLAETQQNYCES